MIYLYYLIIAATLYLIWQSWINYRAEKIEREISREILFSTFKYRK